jgi:hypothetical protein
MKCAVVMSLAGLLSMAAARAAGPPADPDSFRSNDLLAHIQMLASDGFEGRSPGTRGEDLSVGYLIEQFKLSRLQPGNPDGSFIQAASVMLL